MKFSQFAGYSLVPVFSRVVLFLAFLPAGFHKVFHEQTFEGPQARVLRSLGIGEEEPVAAAGGARVHLASWQQDSNDTAQPVPEQEQGQEQEQAPPTTGDLEEKDGSEVPEWVEKAQRKAAGEEEPVVGPVKARALHHITATLVHHGYKEQWGPQYLAWVAALTELLGGALIFVGLFSRIWGLGLAVNMAFAFYLTSFQGLIGGDVGPIKTLFAWGAGLEGYAPFHAMIAQLALLVLAGGIFLTGAGALSADRIFFSGEDPEQGLDDLDEE